jgi:large exoprotein involved in heme utilization and adhesion
MIDGRLSAQIPGANLYLMNPSGLMFGPNATLDVSGSFHATTADYIGLADGGRFAATTPGESVLTAAPPEAFGFLGSNPAGISLDKSGLAVPSEETVSLLGGDIEISGDPELNAFESVVLAAPGGRINIASVASAGEVAPGASVDAPDIGLDGVSAMGEIRISDAAVVDASGESGGTVVIRGGQFVLDGAAVFADTQGDLDGAPVGVDIGVSGTLSVIDAGRITTEAMAAGDSGDIRLQAGSVEVKRSPGRALTYVNSASTGTGDTGDIRVAAGEVTIDRGELSTPTFGPGKSGDITIEAESVLLKGTQEFFSGIFVNTFGSGSGGNLELRATEFRMTDRAWIQANGLGRGDGGRIVITASTIDLRDGSQIAANGLFGEGVADAGDIDITTERLSITGLESAENPFGSDATGIFAGGLNGNGGNVSIVATESAVLTQRASMGSSSFGDGQAGQFHLATGGLEILDGSQIITSAFGSGAGGAIIIDADTAIMSGVNDQPFGDLLGRPSLAPSGVASQSGINGGDAGAIRITARSVDVLDGAVVTTTTFGSGNSGTIKVDSDQLVVAGENATHRDFLSDQGIDDPIGARSSINTNSVSNVLGENTTGNAGAIILSAAELVVGDRGRIASDTEGPGRGGAIEIHAGNVRLSNESRIDSRSRSLTPVPSGDAGNIRILAADTLESANSTVLAQADDADGGNIEINANNLVYLNEGTVISASVGGGEGSGGNVTIDPRFVVLNGSRIAADAFGGPGGNVLIVTDNFIASADSSVTASSAFGVDGEVIIRSPEDTVIVGAEALPESFLDVSSLLSERCAARTVAKVGSFVVLGRGGVPPGPDAALPSSYVDTDVQTDDASTTNPTGSRETGGRQRLVSDSQYTNRIVPAQLVITCGD